MTLLNIEPLSINTHTQTSPALQFPQASATPPAPLLVKAKEGSRKKGRKKGKTYIHTYTDGEREAGGAKKKQRKRRKVVAVREK